MTNMGLHIGINTLFLIPGGVGGTEIYLRHLVRYLALVDRKNEYVLFANLENAGTFGVLPPNFRQVICPIRAYYRPARILWEQLALPLQVKKLGLDLLHSPGYTAPSVLSCPSVVTIHDMNYFYYPEDFSELSVLFLKVLVPLAARRSDKIITVSQNSKEDIARILRVPREKIYVIYEAAGVPIPSAHDKGHEVLLTKYGVKERFILSVAASHPHKNLHRLIRAYSILRKKYLVQHNLVLVGMKGRSASELETLMAELSLSKEVVFTGWVPDEDLPLFYLAADLFVFPSLFEGFGIPILEAMACGIPVISSNAASLPEVVGDAGMLIDPYDVEGMADAIDAIYKALSDTDLRRELVERGLGRVKEFSWKRMARQTLAVYEEACAAS